MKHVPLLVLAAMAVACSRTPEPPARANAPSADKRAAASGRISEQQALALLVSQLKAHKVADLDCLTFASETDAPANGKAERWEFAAREIHDARCGGDPAISHVRDRYAVSATGSVQVYDAAEADYTRF